MRLVWSQWGAELIAAAVAVPVAVLVAVLLTRRRQGDPLARRKSFAEVAAVAGTIPWIWMILTPVGDGRAASLVPLKDLADVFGDRPSVIVAQLGGNLVVFAAAGFFLPIRTVLFAGLARVGVCAALASATVEIAQYGLAMGRVSSVDDVLLNALGAVIAAALSHRWWARPQVKGQGAGVLGEPEVFVERPGLS